uniref:DNA-directed RNA polymerase n=1 Tax=viral metagenome TaxID=1070528 RepID=A0A6C0DEU5_9ZZZZ
MSDNENDNYSSEAETEESENELSEKEEDEEEETPSIKKIMTAVEDSDDDEEEQQEVEDSDEEVEDDDVDDDEDDDDEEMGQQATLSSKTLEQTSMDDDDENTDDDEELEDESYLQKFNVDLNKNYILEYHPECAINNYDEIIALTNVIRDQDNNIIDDLHKTLPYLTKYERARILGQRAKQINSGAKVFVKVPENVIDGYVIAQIELEQKRIPFIIRRPIPGGGCEYWNLKDLEIIGF